MHDKSSCNLMSLPVWPQSQKSLADQMADLVMIGNRLGLYDAADAVKQMANNLGKVEYGCHDDLEPGEGPDGCVIDEGRHNDCIYAKPGMRKEQCEYWRIIAQNRTETTNV
jgi:hypothetical protein